MIDQKLISHQVFETVQGGISDNPMRKGTIIFANKFTGEPVEMSEELRAAINMDGTFIGNNPINQLEKALAGVPGGPWFIDVRNEILYIHNRALDQPASYDYVYGSENGELLRVSFKTQYRTKNAPRGGTMSIDQFSKTLRMQSHSQTSASEITSDETDRTAKDVLIRRARQAYLEAKANTMYPKQRKGGGVEMTQSADLSNFLSYINIGLRRKGKASIGNDINKLYDMSLGSLSSWYDSYLEYLARNTQSHLESYQRSASGSDLRFQQRNKSNEIYQSQSYEEFKPLVADFLNKTLGSPSRYRQEVEQELKKAFQQGPEAVKNVLHRYFDNTTYSQYTHTGLNESVDVDVATLMKGDARIPPAVNGNGTIYFTKSDGRFKQSGEEIGTGTIMSGVVRFMEAAGYQNVTLKAYDVQWGSLRRWVSCKLKVRYRQQMRNYKVISGYQFMYDFYTRYTGSTQGRYTQYLRKQALGANTSRKITQQRLEVEMLVVGRPSLTANGKVKISNIGSRSGDYLIERCIHQITPGEGYTCSLTLTQGIHSEPVGTVTNDVPITSKPKKKGGGTAAGGGTRSRSDGRGGTVNTSPTEPIAIWVTPAERAYYETLLTRSDAVSAKEEFVTQVKYSRYRAYEKAKAEGKSDAEAREAVRAMNQTGIVSVKNKHVTSDNLYLKENLEPHYRLIPQRYRIAYRDEVRAIIQESVNGIKARLG